VAGRPGPGEVHDRDRPAAVRGELTLIGGRGGAGPGADEGEGGFSPPARSGGGERSYGARSGGAGGGAQRSGGGWDAGKKADLDDDIPF
jgi:single-strand DNA-binding protein